MIALTPGNWSFGRSSTVTLEQGVLIISNGLTVSPAIRAVRNTGIPLLCRPGKVPG